QAGAPLDDALAEVLGFAEFPEPLADAHGREPTPRSFIFSIASPPGASPVPNSDARCRVGTSYPPWLLRWWSRKTGGSKQICTGERGASCSMICQGLKFSLWELGRA